MVYWAAAGMGKAINGIEDFLCPLLRDYWSRFTHGDITRILQLSNWTLSYRKPVMEVLQAAIWSEMA